MQNAKISVIIAAYNAANTIEKCINSVLAQEFPWELIEIIVVNDGSTDNMAEVVSKMAFQYKSIKLINQKNMGPGGGRNTGIKFATGDIICMLSSDTYADKNWLRNITTAFTADPKIGVIQGPILPHKEINIPFYHLFSIKTPNWNFPTAAIAYRASAVEGAGKYFDPELSHYGDDTDIAWRILNKGYTSKWVPETTAYHDIIPKNFWSEIKASKDAHRLVLLFKKHPELRKHLRLRIFWTDPLRFLNIWLIFLLPLFFITDFHFTIFLVFTVILVLVRSLRLSFYNRCNPIYKMTLIPLNMILLDIIGFFVLIYGSVKYKTLVL